VVVFLKEELKKQFFSVITNTKMKKGKTGLFYVQVIFIQKANNSG